MLSDHELKLILIMLPDKIKAALAVLMARGKVFEAERILIPIHGTQRANEIIASMIRKRGV